MTILFYVAVHEVMALIMRQRRSGLARPIPYTHEERRGLLRDEWPDVATIYDMLFGWSRRSRYECWVPSTGQLDLAAMQIASLRAEIAKI